MIYLTGKQLSINAHQEGNTPSHILSINPTNSLLLYQLMTLGLGDCRPGPTLHPITVVVVTVEVIEAVEAVMAIVAVVAVVPVAVVAAVARVTVIAIAAIAAIVAVVTHCACVAVVPIVAVGYLQPSWPL